MSPEPQQNSALSPRGGRDLREEKVADVLGEGLSLRRALVAGGNPRNSPREGKDPARERTSVRGCPSMDVHEWTFMIGHLLMDVREWTSMIGRLFMDVS